MNTERVYFMDYIRVLACLMVMLVHSSENFYLCAPEGAPSGEMVDVVAKIMTEDAHFWVAMIDGFCRMSVPLFMIASAYLLCPLREEQSWGSFFRRRALRILPPMICFLVLYSVLPLLWGGTTPQQALKDFLYIPLNFPGTGGHLWFMYPLLSLYLLIPILSPWLRKASPRQELMVIGLFLLSTTMIIFNHFGLQVFGQVWWNPYHGLFPFSGYIGYLVLAHYLRFHLKWSDRKRWAVGLPSIIIGAAITIWSFYVQIELGQEQDADTVELLWHFCTPNVVLMTFGFFLVFSTMKRPLPGYALVKDISRMSYGMYLMHMFWLVMFSGLLGSLMPVGLAIPAIALSSYLCCYLTTKLISLLPGSQWVVGA